MCFNIILRKRIFIAYKIRQNKMGQKNIDIDGTPLL